MPYTKIKHGPKGTTLTRVEDRANEDSVESTLTSHELPRPEFVAALQALQAWVLEVCELPTDYAAGMTVVGVSISLGEHGGCVVTALKQVSAAASPVVINSPHVPAVATRDGGGSLPRRVVEMLEALELEAERFWKGQRAQADLFEAPPADAVAAAIDRMRPDPDSGIESVTLSVYTPGKPTQSVTLPRRGTGGAA